PTPTPTPTATATPRPLAAASLSVHVVPWAIVTIDGAEAGETPIDRQLPAGRHRLRASHPQLGTEELRVTLAPGQRFVWKPKLSK
ncbi:MAG TPA: PEGA domain-containing protein, partial [Anaeromyxobacteraceae bacterium]